MTGRRPRDGKQRDRDWDWQGPTPGRACPLSYNTLVSTAFPACKNPSAWSRHGVSPSSTKLLDSACPWLLCVRPRRCFHTEDASRQWL